MDVRRWSVLAVLWVLSLAAVGYAASQRQGADGPTPGLILSGDDLGFRLIGPQGTAMTGTWVVKIDGKWVEARSAAKVVPVK